MRCSSKYMKAKYWCRHELLLPLSALALLGLLVSKLPACYNEDISARRSSRLDPIQANEDDERDEYSDMKLKHDHLGATGEHLNLADDKQFFRYTQQNYKKIAPYEELDCLINDDYTIKGRKQGNDTYLPFSFLKQYFEVEGKFSRQQDGRLERFDWSHSTARVYDQRPYKSDGTFMTFDHYHVEQRSTVKYISGVEGVPITVQWDPKGYFYAIQIAQYGLSHYTKNITDVEPVVTYCEDAEYATALRKWRRSSSSDARDDIRIVYDEEKASNVVEFRTSAKYAMMSKAFALPLSSDNGFVISFDAMFLGSFSIIVTVEVHDKRTFTLVYTSGDEVIQKKGQSIIYGLGPLRSWRSITRNLVCDYRKGITQTHTTSLKKTKATLNKVTSVSVIGNGRMDNITLWTYNHMAHFMDAAIWLRNYQDRNGGWPVQTERRLDEGMLPIAPGWYSAMAQGQAISTLTRAYRHTKDYSYLKSALRATKLYTIPSSEGGVQAKFLDIFPWYEEYPTSPSSFVLNGFIFSLIGLYDLKCTASVEEGREAGKLFEDGMNSLKNMIHLYDTGSGSIYDLRHVTLRKAPNLARWGYHSVHIAQLQLLASIDSDPILKSTLDRWIGYTKGKQGKSQRNKGFAKNEKDVRRQQ